jgi:dolichol-phosphate mannosyltransferase
MNIKHSQHSFSKKNSKYCLCIFVINEGERLLSQLAKTRTLDFCIDTIIVDGGSTDGSTDKEKLNQFKVNTLLVLEEKGQLGTQTQLAFMWAIENGYEGVITMDGNNKDSPSDALKFIEQLEGGYDFIQGSRFIKGGEHKNTPLSRLLGIKLIHAPLVQLASGYKYTDTTNGFRAYSKKLLTNSLFPVFLKSMSSYNYHYYLSIFSTVNKFKCTEVPVTRIYPKGAVPTKISKVKGNYLLFAGLIKVILMRLGLIKCSSPQIQERVL